MNLASLDVTHSVELVGGYPGFLLLLIIIFIIVVIIISILLLFVLFVGDSIGWRVPWIVGRFKPGPGSTSPLENPQVGSKLSIPAFDQG